MSPDLSCYIKFKQGGQVGKPMEKALARNPNLLRTLLGLSSTLILVLGYSVYSASLDSEYYIHESSLEQNNLTLTMIEQNTNSLSWSTTSEGSISWVNFTLTGAPQDSTLTITSGGEMWWSHPMLGSDYADNFNCIQGNTDFQLENHCEFAFTHSITIDDNGNASLRGLLSDQLPLSGQGTIRATNLSTATTEAEQIVDTANHTVSWLIELSSNNAIDNSTAQIQQTVVTHELTTVYQFKLNPFIESVWSLTALLTCFVMVLALPLGIYYASIKREQRINLIRDDDSESE
ncbi:MAG: hypothetical protein NZ774_04175 [Candidatus Poseidoniales archaeon]|nr:hypothetical protein [Candidatus Poseidoniales archaeon]